MKNLVIEWRHLDVDGEMSARSYDTGENLIAEVKRLNRALNPQGIEVKVIETKLDESELSESNKLYFNNIPIEDILDIEVSENDCGSCTDLLGKPTNCRTIIFEGDEYEAVPAKAIRQAAYKVLELGMKTSANSGCCAGECIPENKKVKGNITMKPRIDMKRCFASKDVCMAIKLCPVKAISYIETDEPILDKTLKCNCDERETRGLTPMSEQASSGGCDCAGGCDSGDNNPLYDCGGTPYGRILIDYDKCVRCGICAKECCGDCIDMVDESENTEDCNVKRCKNVIECACPKTECENNRKCCACVIKHKETDSLPFCLFLDNDGDKSIVNYYRKLKERFEK